jgi:hypothetical protein
MIALFKGGNHDGEILNLPDKTMEFIFPKPKRNTYNRENYPIEEIGFDVEIYYNSGIIQEKPDTFLFILHSG